MSVKEAEEMYDAAEKAGVVFEVHQNRRWDDDYLTVKNIVDNELAGEAYLIESRVMGGNGIPGAWRKEKARGGGMMLDWGGASDRSDASDDQIARKEPLLRIQLHLRRGSGRRV